LTQSGFFLNTGFVTETLPEGFKYVWGSLSGGKLQEYNETTNNLMINFKGQTTITYVVKAGTAEQIENAVFSGTWRTVDSQMNLIDGTVEGDTTLTLSEPTPTPTPTPTEAPPSNGGGGGGGGIPPVPAVETPPYIDLNANPAEIPILSKK